MNKCDFNYKGWCYALACYSNIQCGARDENGNPKYVSNEECKKGIPKTIEANQ